MKLSRTQKAKLNTVFSLLRQAIMLICGLIVPRYLLGAFGSEAYGATASISTFLAYITLLDGGAGAVTRAELYKALASKSAEKISAIVSETKRFFKKIAYAFIVYVLILAVFFKEISGNSIFDFWFSFGLVIVISISTFAEYFFGISYSLLLQADQLDFIQSISRIVVTILNTVAVVVLVNLGCNLLIVKLVSSIVFVLRPVFLSVYVKQKYKLVPVKNTGEPMLKQKWTAMGQHIAWALHNNTDIAVLTIFKSLSLVSVYSVYNMVISKVQDLTSAFSNGMEAVFGSMLANKEMEKLQKTFGYYETMISLMSVTLFSVTASLIVPFVKIYTSNINDTEYIYPAFALALTISSLLYCMRTPYGHMVIAAGHFKQTRIAAYGEAVVNISLSIILVIKLGLLGVAVGTVAATAFRFIYYVIYLSRNVLTRSVLLFIKRFFVNAGLFLLIYIPSTMVLTKIEVNSYYQWVIAGVIITAYSGVIVLIGNLIFYRNDVKEIAKRAFQR